MSSLRNAVKRITHKERAQPRKRAHLGILEKKKDYKHRAVDYHRKQDRMNAMRERALMKNPDEYYFGMKNAQVTDGKHRKTVEAEQKQFEAEVGLDTVRVMKDQDLRYIRLQRQKDSKKVEKLRSTMHLVEKPINKHTIFVDSKKDLEKFDAAEHFDTLPEFLDRVHNRPRFSTLRKNAAEAAVRFSGDVAAMREQLNKDSRLAKKVAKRAHKAKLTACREIQEREKRMASLKRAEAHLVTQEIVASKGRKRKVKAAEHGEPAIYKFRRKRQR